VTNDVHVALLPMRPGGGRHVEHDPASRAHDIARTVPAQVTVEPMLWFRHSPILDQARLRSCTGNAMAGWMACEPHCTTDAAGARFTEDVAVDLYSLATRYDRVPGEYPPTDTGSTGNGVAKAARKMQLIRSWSWAFTTTALLRTLMIGPVIVGTDWTDDMDYPDDDGVITPTGALAGGHEYLVRGWDGTHLVCDNSWGSGWNPVLGGSFKLTLDSWAMLRARAADVTVPHV
jgi:hypothetical protein